MCIGRLTMIALCAATTMWSLTTKIMPQQCVCAICRLGLNAITIKSSYISYQLRSTRATPDEHRLAAEITGCAACSLTTPGGTFTGSVLPDRFNCSDTWNFMLLYVCVRDWKASVRLLHYTLTHRHPSAHLESACDSTALLECLKYEKIYPTTKYQNWGALIEWSSVWLQLLLFCNF